ncbi:hypothetical protein ACPCVL_00700 [Streptomyces koyangensis]|uniref:hypothetical protein n=1 Tax=Streptomyces koyangensis TaxID=188770 RepID=UPI003C2EAD94
MSEYDQGRGRWGDAGGLDGAITGSPRFSVTGGGTRLRVEYRVEGRGVVELNYAPKGEEGEEEVSVGQPRLPWRQEVTMRGPVAIPVLSATLDDDGGRADLVVTVDGRERARVTVSGASATGVCVADPGV